MRSLNLILTFTALTIISTSCHRKPVAQDSKLDQVGIYQTSDISLIEKGKLSREERTRATKEFFLALETNYVLWPYKEQLIEIRPETIRDECVSTEWNIEHPTYRSEFVDRLFSCIARFKDSHLTVGAKKSQSEILTFVAEIMPIDGRYYIAQNRPELIKYWEARYDQFSTTLEEDLKVGTEIVSINGIPVKQEIDRLRKYISASSDGSEQLWARWAVTRRDYSYPENNFLSVEVATKNGTKKLKLPWFYYPNSDLETDVLLGQKGFISAHDAFVTKTDNGFQVLDLAKPAGPSARFSIYSNEELEDVSNIYRDEKAKQVFLTYSRLKGKSTCYVKIHTFDLSNALDTKVYKSDRTNVTLGDVLNHITTSCLANSDSLQIDLRSNGGGNPYLASDIASLLLAADSNIVELFAYHASTSMWPAVSEWRTHAYEDANYNNDDVTREVYSKAFEEGALTTDWAVKKIISKELFQGEIKIITSPDCVSACDIFAMIFKNSGRATIIGQPTSGTGAGFQGSSGVSSKYTDRLNLFTVEIPNFLFNYPSLPNAGDNVKFDSSLIVENKPFAPDIPYELTLKDITENFADLKVLLNK